MGGAAPTQGQRGNPVQYNIRKSNHGASKLEKLPMAKQISQSVRLELTDKEQKYLHILPTQFN